MAEEIVWNKKLLIASLVLAVVAVGLFMLYDKSQKEKLHGDMVQVLKWKRDISGGEEIAQADVAVVEITTAAMDAMEGVLTKQDLALVTGESHVNRSVRKNDFVRYKDIYETRASTPANLITPGMRGFTLRVDPNYMPGDILRAGERVDVVGLVAVKGPPRAYTLVQYLRVLGVGGISGKQEEKISSGRARRYDPGRRVYRSVVVEVSPEMVEQLADLLPRVQGTLWLTVRNPRDTKVDFKGINPQVKSVLRQPLPAKGGGTGIE